MFPLVFRLADLPEFVTAGATAGITGLELNAMFDQQKLLIIGAFRALSDLAAEPCPSDAVRAERQANVTRFQHILGQLLRQQDATHLAALAHHEYVGTLERAVNQLHADTMVAAQNFSDMQRTLATTNKSFMGVIGTLMAHVSDYKNRVANHEAEQGFREEISAILRLHAQHLFAEMVTKDATIANAAAVIAAALEADKQRPSLVSTSIRQRTTHNTVTTTTDVVTTTSTAASAAGSKKRTAAAVAAAAAAAVASTSSTAAAAAGGDETVEDASASSEANLSDDEEDSMGAEVKRISEHLLRKVKRRRDQLLRNAQRDGSAAKVPSTSIEAKLALYPDDPDNSNLVHHARSKLPSRATAVLKQWLFENWYHPYPSDAVKRRLGEEAGLTVPKINNWFTNARRRILPKKPAGSHTRVFDNIGGGDDEAKAGGLDRGSTALLFASVGLPVPPFDVHLPPAITSSLLSLQPGATPQPPPQQQQQQQPLQQPPMTMPMQMPLQMPASGPMMTMPMMPMSAMQPMSAMGPRKLQ